MNQPQPSLLQNPDDQREAFNALCDGWLANELSPEQATRLAATLRQDPQAARHFAAHAREWQLLASVAHQQILAAQTSNSGDSTLAGPGNQHGLRWSGAAMAMAAALAAAVLWFLLPGNQPAASTELASLSTDTDNGEVATTTGLRLTPPARGSVTMAFDRQQQRRVVLTVHH